MLFTTEKVLPFLILTKEKPVFFAFPYRKVAEAAFSRLIAHHTM